MMFSLSFVGGSKSAEGGPNPLADLTGGSITASGFGRGGSKSRWGPNPLGHRQHAIERDVDLHVEIECLKKCDTYTIEASK